MNAYKKPLAISMIFILLPCLIGLLLWNHLPDRLPTHFSYTNEVDRYSSKAFVVFGMPALLTALQILCFFAACHEPQRLNISRKIYSAVFAIIPAIAVLICILTYGTGLGYQINSGLLVNLFLGILFLVIGNYLPKVKRNFTMGIKIPWTLNSEDNWNKTHHLAGRLWMISGLLFIANSFFLNPALFIGALLLMVAIPGIYSFLLYKRGI